MREYKPVENRWEKKKPNLHIHLSKGKSWIIGFVNTFIKILDDFHNRNCQE